MLIKTYGVVLHPKQPQSTNIITSDPTHPKFKALKSVSRVNSSIEVKRLLNRNENKINRIFAAAANSKNYNFKFKLLTFESEKKTRILKTKQYYGVKLKDNRVKGWQIFKFS